MSDDNTFTRLINLHLYGAPPSKEVSAHDDWDYCVTADPELTGHFYRHGEGVKVLKRGVRFTQTEYDWIPNEEAQVQLRSLMDEWRAKGWTKFADEVETREEFDGEESQSVSVYDSMGVSKSRRVSKTLPFSAVKFYKELPHDPVEGLRQAINQPRTNGRITNLSTLSGIEP